MKQLIVMALLTLAGTAGVVVVSPFWGVAVYYLFAVLRPQFLWEWSLPPGIAWSYYVAVVTILAAVAQLAAGPNGTGDRRRLSGAHMAVLAFGAWLGVSFLMARDREAALPWTMEYVKIFVMFAAAALLIRGVRQVWILMVMTMLAVAYVAYEINFAYLAHGYMGIYFNGYGGLDNNGAGLMLAMAIPLCYFVWEGSTGRLRWACLVFIPVLLHAVLMTYSRGAMVALLAITPLIWLRSRHRGWLTLGALPLVCALPLMAGPEIRARFFSISTYEQDATAQQRIQSWQAAWGIIQDNPVFGVGIRNANLFSYQYGADAQGRTIHNLYLQTAADTGLVGLGLYLMALGAVWLALQRVRREFGRGSDPESRRVHALTCAVECALAVYWVGSLFLSLEVFEMPYLLLLLGAQLGTMLVRDTASQPRRLVRTSLAPQAV